MSRPRWRPWARACAARVVLGPGRDERRNRETVLPLRVQGRAAGGQHGHTWAPAQQLGHQRRRRQQVLEVVQLQEHLLVAQVLLEQLARAAPARLGQAQAPGDGGRHQPLVAQRGQVDERHPVGVALGQPSGGGQRQPRLAAAAHARQRDQPRLGQQVRDRRQLRLPPDEAGQGRWQVAQANFGGVPRPGGAPTPQRQDSDKPAFRVIVEGERIPLQPLVRDELYRIGREALINAFRHARARNIEIEVKYSANRLNILVRDDGCGIDATIVQSGREGHFGLPGMRERADRIRARFRVMSSASAGTEIELSVPGSVAFRRETNGEAPWFSKAKFFGKGDRE